MDKFDIYKTDVITDTPAEIIAQSFLDKIDKEYLIDLKKQLDPYSYSTDFLMYISTLSAYLRGEVIGGPYLISLVVFILANEGMLVRTLDKVNNGE